MIYGRSLGESFGLSCAEFILENKKILFYKYNRHRAHEYQTSKELLIEYGSYKELYNILLDFKFERIKINNSKYKNFNKKYVMKIFKKVFLSERKRDKISLIDFFYTHLGKIKMNIFYIKHKIYNHYFKFIESKFI